MFERIVRANLLAATGVNALQKTPRQLGNPVPVQMFESLFFGISSGPRPIAVAPAAMNSAAVCWLTPPTAISATCGNGPLSAWM